MGGAGAATLAPPSSGSMEPGPSFSSSPGCSPGCMWTIGATVAASWGGGSWPSSSAQAISAPNAACIACWPRPASCSRPPPSRSSCGRRSSRENPRTLRAGLPAPGGPLRYRCQWSRGANGVQLKLETADSHRHLGGAMADKSRRRPARSAAQNRLKQLEARLALLESQLKTLRTQTSGSVGAARAKLETLERRAADQIARAQTTLKESLDSITRSLTASKDTVE